MKPERYLQWFAEKRGRELGHTITKWIHNIYGDYIGTCKHCREVAIVNIEPPKDKPFIKTHKTKCIGGGK